jgi:hypothetical protein
MGDMALFTEYPGRERNPLGGQESAEWDAWIREAARMASEAREALRDMPLTHDNGKVNVLRYMSVNTEREHSGVLAEWESVQRRDRAGDTGARDRFEVGLISRVMSAHGAAEFARQQGYGPDDTTAGGRPMADVSGEYMRACTILARYVGVDPMTVVTCDGDQARLSALRPFGTDRTDG